MPAKEEKPKQVVITSVRNLRKSIKIEYTQGTDAFTINCHDMPQKSFYTALEKLAPHVCALCDFAAKDSEKISATGITVREKGDNNLALIVARKTIKRGKRVFNISTPLLPMYADDENKTADHMDEEEAKAIEKVISEAKKYVAGDRAQGQIEFEDDEPETKKGKADDTKEIEFPQSEPPRNN